MKKNKKYLFAFLIIIGLYFIVINLAEFYIEKKINSEYDVTYNDFNLTVTANLQLKDLSYTSEEINLKAEKLQVNIGLWKTLFSDQTIIDQVNLYKAKLTYRVKAQKEADDKSESSQIDLKKLYIEGLDAIVIKQKDTLAQVTNLDVTLSEPLNADLDASHLDYFNLEELHYRLDQIQDLSVYNFAFTGADFTIDSLHVDSDYTKENYINQLSKEKDLITHKSYGVQLTDFSLGLASQKLQKIGFDNIKIDSSRTLIYRDKTIADDKSIKSTYGQSLQGLDFDLAIDEIAVQNSQLTYSERLSQKKVSEVVFNNLSVTIQNFHNVKSRSDERLKLIGSFALNPQSELDVAIAYNQFAAVETFQLDLSGGAIDTKSLNKILKPSMSLGMQGRFEEIKAQILTQKNAHGDFELTAKDLELTMYSDSGRERKIMSFVANKLLNKDISKKIKIEKVERNPTKSMWNFIWTYIKTGLTKILL
ncbi:MAG: hypothetical protein L0J45_03500 [Psychroflexus sp.]|nr:hypothetical protein [Psychroflexus sp.]MDN6311151.1 hypothetical protein [Psychroflexus sp.]